MATIREQQLNLLQTNGKENIKFYIFDYTGSAKGTVTKDVLVSVPNNIQPINENLSIEYLRPLRNVILRTELNKADTINKNPTFRYKNYNWSISTGNSVQLQGVLDPIPVSVSYFLKSQQTVMTIVDTDKGTAIITNEILKTYINTGSDIEFGFNYYFNTWGGGGDSYIFYITAGLDTTGNGSIDMGYNFEDNKFEAGSGSYTADKYFKKIQTNSMNQWVKFTQILNAPQTTNESPRIKVEIYPPFRSSTGETSLRTNYYDVIYIANRNTLGKKYAEKREYGIYTLGGVIQESKLTGTYEREEVYNTNNLQDSLFLGKIQGEYKRKNFDESQTLDGIISQEIINDYRTSVKRYEGDFYRKDVSEDPIQFHNKVWVNFGTNVLQDPVSAMIDSMEFKVKSNEYSIVMHLPNQNDDIQSFIQTYYED